MASVRSRKDTMVGLVLVAVSMVVAARGGSGHQGRLREPNEFNPETPPNSTGSQCSSPPDANRRAEWWRGQGG